MAKDNLVAKKYAEALVEIDASEKTLNSLKLVNQSFIDSPELKSSLENPSVSEESKLEIIEQVFKAELSEAAINLLKLCVTRRRTNVIGLLAEHYENAFLNKNNIELASLESAQTIDSADLEDIKEQLEKVFNKGIKIEAKSNPELIAGVKINVNNKVIDYSLDSKIKKIKQSLK